MRLLGEGSVLHTTTTWWVVFLRCRGVWQVVTPTLARRALRALPTTVIANLYSLSEAHDVAVLSLQDLDFASQQLAPRMPGTEVSAGGASCPFERIPCGLVLPNVECHILDDRLTVMDVGQWGDVYLSGPSLAVGYLDRPDLTAERFVCLSLAEALDDSQVFYLHLNLWRSTPPLPCTTTLTI